MSYTDQPENHTLGWVGRMFKCHLLQWPCNGLGHVTRSGCSDTYPIQPWMFQGMGHLQRKPRTSVLPCAHQAPYNELQWLLLEDICYPYDGTRQASQYGGPSFWFIVGSESEEREEKGVRRNQNGFIGSRWKSISCSPSLLGVLEKQVLYRSLLCLLPPLDLLACLWTIPYSSLTLQERKMTRKSRDPWRSKVVFSWGQLVLQESVSTPYPKKISSKS